MTIWIIFAVITGVMLIALMFRFMQPELIYAMRNAAVAVSSRKAFLEFVNKNPDANKILAREFMRGLRYDMRFCDADYALERVGRLRELYRILDPRRNTSPAPRGRQKPQICIVELGEIIKSLGKQVEISDEMNRPTIGAAALLKHLASQINKIDSLQPVTDEGLEYWLLETPVSVEQAVELVSAGVIALAYRIRAQELRKTGELLSSDPDLQMLGSIRRLERTLRSLLRSEYERAFGTTISQEIEGSLGSADYKECLRRMQTNRQQVAGIETDVIDFLYLAQLARLLAAHWNLFHPILGSKDIFEDRIRRILPARNQAAHSSPIWPTLRSGVQQDCDTLLNQITKYRQKHGS
jgi:hypothetical protein